MPRIRVDSITIYASHATVNSTTASAGLPATGLNFNITKDEAYSRSYEPGQEYDFTLTPVPADAGSPDEDSLAPVGAQPNQSPGIPAADVNSRVSP